MRRVRTVETAYQKFEVWQGGRETEFRVAGAVHAWHHETRFLTGLAWDMIAAGVLLAEKPPRSVLMLGLAGGTALRVLRHLLPDSRLVAVEIDAGIVACAREFMALDSLGVEVVMADAYEWLARCGERFDVVVDDLYLAGADDVFRPAAMDGTMLRLYRKALKPGGRLAVNLVTGKGHRTMQSSIRKTLGEAFPELRSVRLPEALNEVLVAGREVSTGRVLPFYQEQFADPRDRKLWGHLRVSRIHPPQP
jgi:spermidine synthase